MTENYDSNNVFARILRRELSVRLVQSDMFFMSFYDQTPKAPIHVLTIPTGAYRNFVDFMNRASLDEIYGFNQGVLKTINYLGLEQNGFRLISNTGNHGRQEVFHYHIHILGGTGLNESIN